ncbi:MAG TPA: amidohydrolase family protein, partial [Planctomycetaceae bacterium]|nr:amidohydrolase family protein [Planctomycetaceae bacterium]
TAYTRRRFWGIAAKAAAGSISCAGKLALAARIETSAPLIIDCHAHVYSLDETKYPTIPNPYRPPIGQGTIDHLRREMRGAGVRLATAVQTSTFYQWDNRFIADASDANRDVIVGICTLNPDDRRSPSILNRYVTQANVRGLRSIPAQSRRLDDPGVEALWSAAERLGITVNVLVNRDKRRELESLARRHPALPVVIDHCLNLHAGREQNEVLSDMLALARIPNLHAKLSYLATGSRERFPFRDMHGSCHAIIDAFGPTRCVWGSDFPCQLWCPKATYSDQLRLFTHELGLEAEAKRHILGETARRLYFSRHSVS